MEINDFSGGIVDNYLAGNVNQFRTLDNCYIDENKKLLSRYGCAIWDDTNYQIPAGEQRIGSMVDFQDTLLVQSAANIYYVDSTWQTLAGPTTNPVSRGTGTGNYYDYAEWNDHLFVVNDDLTSPMKIYKDGSGDWQLRNAGMAGLASDPTITPDSNDTASYIYYFLYYYTYSVGTVTYEDFGTTTFVSSTSSADMSGVGHYNQISVIPVLANSTTENYATTAVKVKVYRTTDNGIVPYYVGEVTNGTTTFQDTVTDATLVNNVQLYTNGGVYDNDTPPPAKYITVVDNIAWYGYVLEGSEQVSYRVRQSKKNDPDSCPSEFFIDMDEEITGIDNVNGYCIVFCKKGIYRLEGYRDLQGNGFIAKRKIHSTAGCVSNRSIIAGENVLFFAGQNGFYVTDGYSAQRISPQIEATYTDLVATAATARKIYATRDNKNQRVYWSLQSGTTEVDTVYVFHERYGTFTTWSGGTNFRPTSIIFFGNDFYRSDSRGYIFKHDSDCYTDLVIDTTAVPSTWTTTAIEYDITSSAYNFGSSSIRKWVPWITYVLANESKLSLQINSINDDTEYEQPLAKIRFRNSINYGDPEIDFGDSDISYYNKELIKGKRRFPRRSLRCTYKQVQFKNSDSVIFASDSFTTATVNNVANTAVLEDTTNYSWPNDIENYYITFEEDNYTKRYLITSRSDDTIIFRDNDDTAPNGTVIKWQIAGTRKGERIKMLSYVVNYIPISNSNEAYDGVTGGNS